MPKKYMIVVLLLLRPYKLLDVLKMNNCTYSLILRLLVKFKNV